MGSADSGMGAGPRRVFPPEGPPPVLESSHADEDGSWKACVFSRQWLIKGRGDGGGGGVSLRRKKTAGQQDPSRGWGALSREGRASRGFRQQQSADVAVGLEVGCHTGHAGDPGSTPELGGSPGGGNGNPLQYS